jgi:hypothetical protein
MITALDLWATSKEVGQFELPQAIATLRQSSRWAGSEPT